MKTRNAPRSATSLAQLISVGEAGQQPAPQSALINALDRGIAFMEGFEDDESQETVTEDLAFMRKVREESVARPAAGGTSSPASYLVPFVPTEEPDRGLRVCETFGEAEAFRRKEAIAGRRTGEPVLLPPEVVALGPSVIGVLMSLVQSSAELELPDPTR
jgi:hypothetical protein